MPRKAQRHGRVSRPSTRQTETRRQQQCARLAPRTQRSRPSPRRPSSCLRGIQAGHAHAWQRVASEEEGKARREPETRHQQSSERQGQTRGHRQSGADRGHAKSIVNNRPRTSAALESRNDRISARQSKRSRFCRRAHEATAFTDLIGDLLELVAAVPLARLEELGVVVARPKGEALRLETLALAHVGLLLSTQARAVVVAATQAPRATPSTSEEDGTRGCRSVREHVAATGI
eukprot:4326634-Pleurochrysis_carterae.AAC.2